MLDICGFGIQGQVADFIIMFVDMIFIFVC